MILFLDTETTGKWDFNRPWDHPVQPNLLQLGMLLCQDDPDCTQIRSLNVIVRPGLTWEWSEEAERVHGINRDWAIATGEPLEAVVDQALGMLREADNDGLGGRVVAHNIQFDTNILLRSFAVCDKNPSPYTVLRPFCTMRSLTHRMNLPGKWPGKPKWPTLDEAYAFTLERQLPAEGRHSAMGDLLACRDIFSEGRKRGWWS